MVPVSAFLSRLLPNVIGCPEPTALQALVDAAIEFCESTLAVRSTLDPADLVSGNSTYELDLPSQTLLSQVVTVRVNDRVLQALPSSQVYGVLSSGGPTAYYAEDVEETLVLRLAPIPDKDEAGALVVRVATRPTRSATQFHSALFNEWAEVLVDGALSRLYDIPDQAFTDYAKALVLQQRFRHKANMARIQALHGRAVSSMSVTLRGF